MNKLTYEQLGNIEQRGWIVREYDDCYELETASPAGEDLIVTLLKDSDLAQQAENNFAYFDEEEHVEMWVSAKRHGVSGIPSIETLVDDAVEIKKLYGALADVFVE